MSRIKVLVVDDSVVVRRLVGDVLTGDPEIEVVGTAANGRLALSKLQQVAPDVVTMDVEMPDVNGIEAVRSIRASGSKVPIIMFSTLTDRGAAATLDALAAGANDYVTKPANVGSVGESMAQVRDQLIPRIKALVPRARGRLGPGSPAGPAAAPAGAPLRLATPRTHRDPFQVLAIGCSTGGPDALATFLAALPADLPVPVVVVQHMPPVFTRQFAQRLDRQLPLTVVESAGGERLLPGVVHIAPGDHHLEVARRGDGVLTRTHQGPPENFCRPAVDVLFRSVADVYGARVLAVVLTGMGSDGRRGAERVVADGGAVLVQDEHTSVVWGMPGAVATAGLAEQVLPLDDLGPAVAQRLTGDPTGRRVAFATATRGGAR
ncbi:protein-glutamate methylesterase/protein-glutamine glutaminase [Thalassiella azotivora]